VKEPASQDVYSDPNVKHILQLLLRNVSTTITHQILPSDEVVYPRLDPILKEDGAVAETVLNRMTASGVLIAEVVDKAPACPECGSRQISSRYLCAKCYTYDITRSFLLEHLKCGKVASDDNFRKDGQLICPKCQTVLHDFGIEFRAVGAWYRCNQCNNSFNSPAHSHFCRQNHHQFTPDRARLIPIYNYKLNMSKLNEIRRQILVYADLITTLEDNGLKVFAPHTMTGKSGETRTFDVAITKKARWGNEKTIAIDIITSDTEVGAEAIRDFAAKIRDAKPAASYLVVVPKLKDDARNLARDLKLTCIESPSINEVTGTIRGLEGIKQLLP